MPPLARPPKIRLSVPRVLRMMVEASATPGFVVPFFRHAQVDALAVVRKPFTETYLSLGWAGWEKEFLATHLQEGKSRSGREIQSLQHHHVGYAS